MNYCSAKVEEYLKKLPEQQRKVLEMKIFKDMSYNLFRHGAETVYLRENLRKFARSDDEEVVAEAIRWLDECCAASGNSLDKANFMRIKAMLQQKTGDARGAQISRDETEKHLQEFRKRKN